MRSLAQGYASSPCLGTDLPVWWSQRACCSSQVSSYPWPTLSGTGVRLCCYQIAPSYLYTLVLRCYYQTTFVAVYYLTAMLLPDRLLVASFLNDRILSYDLGGRFLVSTPPLSPPPLLPRPLRLCAPSFLLPFLFSLSPPPSSPPFSTSALCSLPPPRFSFSLSSFLRLPSSSPAPPPPLSRPCSHLPSLFLLSSTHFSISASASSHSY